MVKLGVSPNWKTKKTLVYYDYNFGRMYRLGDHHLSLIKLEPNAGFNLEIFIPLNPTKKKGRIL
jgi:hypothetical protein